MRRHALLLALLGACGGPDDPCADITGSCLAVRVTSATVDEIDQLELDILHGDRHATATTGPDGGVVGLPLDTAITLADDADPIDVSVVAAGKLAGVVLGTGAASVALARGTHGELAIELAPIDDCVAGSFYCGGDRLAGDPEVLYQCNAGGVPLARGVCVHGCVLHPTDDDACRAGPDTCTDGGFYCGGDELEGDPSTLYRCSAGAGTAPMVCADGCVVAPSGSDDACR